MDVNIFELIQLKKQENEIMSLISYNDKTEQFGLTLTNEEAKELVISRNESLKKYQRVEFGKGILDNIIYNFCDSQYINQENYADSLMKLQDIFYMFKNETEDRLTDDELLTFMREQFDGVCSGDIEHLADTCLERYARYIRGGYTGYLSSGGHKEYDKVDEEERWDKDLYMQVLKDICWK